jgi:hypothetical protein
MNLLLLNKISECQHKPKLQVNSLNKAVMTELEAALIGVSNNPSVQTAVIIFLELTPKSYEMSSHSHLDDGIICQNIYIELFFILDLANP